MTQSIDAGMRPLVAIARAVEGPEYERVSAAVRQAVNLAGGLTQAIKPGDKVILKPNLVAVPPSPESGACTSAAVCRALCDMLNEIEAYPIIAESSSRGVDTEEVMQAMGYDRLRKLGYEVVDLKRTPTVKVSIPNGVVLKETITYQPVMEADAIISVPVMKTHDQTDVTLSLKNLKGLITDAEKRRCHQIGVFEAVADLAQLFQPVFAVVDGIMAQEGLGPVYGLPVPLGLVVAGRQPLAVDAVASSVMGFDAGEIALLRTAAERGLGTLALDQIEVAGERIEDVRRRFMRMEEDDRIAVEGVEVIHAEGSCTGCRNGVLSSLFDMIQAGTIEAAKGMVILTGGAEPPQGVPAERIVPVGICCPAYLRAYPRYVKGCPPNNSDIVAALMG